MPAPPHTTVRSSDLVDWDFCALKLYYERVERRVPRSTRSRDAARADGTSRHAAHNADVASASRTSRVAHALALIGVMALALMLLLGLAGCSPSRVSEAQSWIGAFGAGFVVLALALNRASAEMRRRTGIPAHLRMLSRDAGARRGDLLRDDRLGLVGRPDYVFSRRSGLRTRIYTAEVKSRTKPRRPFHGHVLQTAASVHLARIHHGGRASSRGLLVYDDGSVDVELTPALSRELRDAVAAIRSLLDSPIPPPRNHTSPRRCAACPFASDCPASLASTSGL
jgi:CRISPR/Cas system-associated exonuclease Cas4 (RecB family)